MQSKIRMKTPLVEMDGDEMTRVLWAMIKEKLIEPYVELRTEYYDLGLTNRDDTNDGVTVEAANAIKKYGVGVKCATITPNAQRVSEYNLKEMWKSPNGTIRSILDGTVFREPIMVDNIKPYVRTWEESIIIARHAYGDVYSAVEMQIDGPGTAELVFTSETGERKSRVIKGFNGKGIIQGMHNTEESISHFAHSCFRYALDRKRDLWFATKDTISKTYDHRFKDIFEEIYESEYRELFEAAGIEYFYTLIDDIVARIISGRGGMVWAC
ncbi:MAG TPA: NADP-dependent isocitrate dehydrogenase, partial [Clostridia bacterium]|nr:NADP-dependent isocitrate dehydrogenase [Clostridia bacterium]